MLDYAKLKAFEFPSVVQKYDDRDVFLYALALGLGTDPLDAQRLRFVFEKDALVLPTFAAVLGAPGMWTREHPELGIAYEQMVHGEQRIDFHRPLPLKGSVVARSRIGRVVDKGEGRGALVEVIRDVASGSHGESLATVKYVLFCRADGGFSGASGASDAPGEPLPATPQRAPDATFDAQTRPDAALLYRLTGDRNWLHADPAVAARAGFDRPILHGLATYGIAGAAVQRAFAADDPRRMRSLACRFSSPVFPGESLRTELWRDGDRVSFRAVVPERNAVVLSHGVAELHPA